MMLIGKFSLLKRSNVARWCNMKLDNTTNRKVVKKHLFSNKVVTYGAE